VYPIRLTENLNLINRFLIPVISQGRRTAESGRQKGLGDITYQAFLSPSKAGPLVWGVGPAIVFRTGTNDLLTSDKWSIGPNAVLIAMPGRWVVGGLLSNVWSFAGADGARGVSLMTIQPFANYNFDGGWYLTSAPVITANWKMSSSNTWTVPLGGGLGRVFRFGKQPLNARLAGYYNAEKPDDASDWTLSAQLTFLFPQ